MAVTQMTNQIKGISLPAMFTATNDVSKDKAIVSKMAFRVFMIYPECKLKPIATSSACGS